MVRIAWAVLAVFGLLTLAACSREPDEPPPVTAPDDGRRPVLGVVDIEVGTLRDGYMLTVFGETPTPGWSSAELRLMDTMPGPDGFLDVDFVALPPTGEPTIEAAGAPERMRRVRGDLVLPEDQRRRLSGVRVHTAGGVTSVNLRR